ncbi:MAG: hypothetical protein JNM30_09055 [Rhodospirillales bacterium]|nr:hypothetical protein [Rhodospirillales bacterium]
MTPDRFATLIDAYGASSERWPAPERQAALAYLQATPAAQALVAEAGRLDALLDRLETPAIEIDLARITAVAQESTVVAFKPRARAWPQQMRQWARAGALAAAGICGLVVGMENFSDQAVRSVNASTALELYDAGQVEDVSW